jgi:hypothetical protein
MTLARGSGEFHARFVNEFSCSRFMYWPITQASVLALNAANLRASKSPCSETNRRERIAASTASHQFTKFRCVLRAAARLRLLQT